MKTIYELIYLTKDGHCFNVLFADEEKAKQHLEKYYSPGTSVDSGIIDHSYIIDRILF